MDSEILYITVIINEQQVYLNWDECGIFYVLNGQHPLINHKVIWILFFVISTTPECISTHLACLHLWDKSSFFVNYVHSPLIRVIVRFICVLYVVNTQGSWNWKGHPLKHLCCLLIPNVWSFLHFKHLTCSRVQTNFILMGNEEQCITIIKVNLCTL